MNSANTLGFPFEPVRGRKIRHYLQTAIHYSVVKYVAISAASSPQVQAVASLVILLYSHLSTSQLSRAAPRTTRAENTCRSSRSKRQHKHKTFHTNRNNNRPMRRRLNLASFRVKKHKSAQSTRSELAHVQQLLHVSHSCLLGFYAGIELTGPTHYTGTVLEDLSKLPIRDVLRDLKGTFHGRTTTRKPL